MTNEPQKPNEPGDTTNTQGGANIGGGVANSGGANNFGTAHNIIYNDYRGNPNAPAPVGQPSVAEQKTLAPEATARRGDERSALGEQGTLIYGPKTGTLDGGLLTLGSVIVSAKCKVRDFVAEIDICNPCRMDDRNTCLWDFGLLFRSTGTGEYYRLYLQQDRRWYFDIATGLVKMVKTDVGKPLSEGLIENFRIEKNDWNTLRLRVMDDEAQFYVNGVFITKLATSRKKVRGDVSIVNNIRGGTPAFSLKSIRFIDFRIWSLDKS